LVSGGKLITNLVPLSFNPSPTKGLVSRSWLSLGARSSCGWRRGNFLESFFGGGFCLQSSQCFALVFFNG
jgi:hypothetical protein